MYRNRIIPCLLLQNDGLVKTKKFENPTYIGDPINAVKIFNDKQVDELFFLDISASERGTINFDLLKKISSQSFMPLGYGGGVTSFEDAQKLFSLGFEKVSLNTAALDSPDLIEELVRVYGSQSVVVTIDVKKNFLGKKKVYNHVLKKSTKKDPLEYAKTLESLGVGEIVLNSVDNDGLMTGYDISLISEVSSQLSIPLVALGGAGSKKDLDSAIKAGASASAAGSLFVYYGKHRAVLINYPMEQSV